MSTLEKLFAGIAWPIGGQANAIRSITPLSVYLARDGKWHTVTEYAKLGSLTDEALEQELIIEGPDPVEAISALWNTLTKKAACVIVSSPVGPTRRLIWNSYMWEDVALHHVAAAKVHALNTEKAQHVPK